MIEGILVIVGIAVVLILMMIMLELRKLPDELAASRATYVQEQRITQKRTTLDFLISTLTQRLEFLKVIPSPKNQEATQNFIKRAQVDTDVQNAILGFLNYHEYLAAGANHGILDLDVVYSAVGTSLIRTFEQYEGFIRDLRQRENHLSLYAELEELAARLRTFEKGQPRTFSRDDRPEIA